MATKFTYDRLFGDDITPKLRLKLEARQNLNAGADFGDYILDTSDPSSWNMSFSPYEDASENDFIRDGHHPGGDLSSRTVWGRIWTAIHTYSLKPTIEELTVQAKTDPAEYSAEMIPLSTKIYTIGNNRFENYVKNRLNPHGDEGVFLSKNDFNLPNVGIESINSQTSGYMGLVKETTIVFKVHNFYDYENIIVPYFMTPGAKVFCDFGWSTSHIYAPEDFLDNSNQKSDNLYKSFFEKVYEKEDGLITKSNGDLEVIMGVVSKFNSKVNQDGSFTCNITLTSENYSLIDYSQSTGISFPTIVENEVNNVLINRLKELTKGEVDITAEDAEKYEKEVGNTLALLVGPQRHMVYYDQFGEKGPSFPEIPPHAYDVGLYTRLQDDTLASQVKDVTALNIDDSKYVTFKKLGEILNKSIGKTMAGYNDAGIEFTFTNQLVRFDQILYARQMYSQKTASKNLSLLYPTRYFEFYEEQETINGKPILVLKRDLEDPHLLVNDQDTNLADVESILLEECFINLKLVYDIFDEDTNPSIKDAMKALLDKINDDSENFFNLKMMDGGFGNKIVIIDANHSKGLEVQKYLQDDKGEYKIPIFEFKAFSPNTIMDSMDLSMTIDNNNLGNRLAIQGMTADTMLFPVSDQMKVDMAVKDQNTTQPGTDSFDPYQNNNQYFMHIPMVAKETNTQIMKNNMAIYNKPDLKEVTTATNADKLEKESTINHMRNVLSNMLEFDGDILPSFASTDKGGADDRGPQSQVEEGGLGISLEDPDLSNQDFPKDLYIKSTTDYFKLKLNGTEVENKVRDVIMPYTLSFSIYGISGLLPGNRFKIDYIPKRQRKTTYFIITKVSHSIQSGKWRTSIEAQMRLGGEDSFNNIVQYHPNIHMSKRKLYEFGYSTTQITDIHDNNKDFWREVPELLKQYGCKDIGSMNYNEHTEFDCIGDKKEDAISGDVWGNNTCCRYCPNSTLGKGKNFSTRNSMGGWEGGAHENGWWWDPHELMCKSEDLKPKDKDGDGIADDVDNYEGPGAEDPAGLYESGNADYSTEVKAGCLDPDALNYCSDCNYPCTGCCEYPACPSNFPGYSCVDINAREDQGAACESGYCPGASNVMCCPIMDYAPQEPIYQVGCNENIVIGGNAYNESQAPSAMNYCGHCINDPSTGECDEFKKWVPDDCDDCEGGGFWSCCVYPEGCTNQHALNFHPYATIDDGSCVFTPVGRYIAFGPAGFEDGKLGAGCPSCKKGLKYQWEVIKRITTGIYDSMKGIGTTTEALFSLLRSIPIYAFDDPDTSGTIYLQRLVADQELGEFIYYYSQSMNEPTFFDTIMEDCVMWPSLVRMYWEDTTYRNAWPTLEQALEDEIDCYYDYCSIGNMKCLLFKDCTSLLTQNTNALNWRQCLCFSPKAGWGGWGCDYYKTLNPNSDYDNGYSYFNYYHKCKTTDGRAAWWPERMTQYWSDCVRTDEEKIITAKACTQFPCQLYY
jgi:hypothetical protein